MRIGIAQINTTVGDFPGNAGKIMRSIDRARSLKVDLLVLPELAVTGYPPEDLILRPQFIRQNRQTLNEVVGHSSGLSVVVGFVDGDCDIYNAAAVISNKKLVGVSHKSCLSKHGSFDESRYFHVGSRWPIFLLRGIGIGITIGEDIWHEARASIVRAYSGAGMIINISASPYRTGRGLFREETLAAGASETTAVVVHSNLVGGQDEVVFDGASVIIDESGAPIARGKQFDEDFIVAELEPQWVARSQFRDPVGQKDGPRRQQTSEERLTIDPGGDDSHTAMPTLPPRQIERMDDLEEVYQALVLGTKDYVRKNGFDKAVLGLSGGIDSSLVAAIAVDAVGPESVIGIAMPSRYSSPDSESDAAVLARNLGMRFLVIPIEQAFSAYLETLAEHFKGTRPDVAEENIQARIRANILFALSNKFRWLVLSCSNKSELATGYGTIYGDMAGGLVPLKDVYKTTVLELARDRNRRSGQELIPPAVLTKAPSAELRPDQRDTDTLPPYELLDAILRAYVDNGMTIDQIIAMGYDAGVAMNTARLVRRAEYKRRQAAPGIMIASTGFGCDRRLPITNRFMEERYPSL